MRLLTIAFLLITSITIPLTLSSRSNSAQTNQNSRPSSPQNPLPPRNSGPISKPTPRISPTPCPGFGDCTAWNNSTPTQIHVEFPGPNHMTLHGHLYIPGVKSKADLDALTNSYKSKPEPANEAQGKVQKTLTVVHIPYPVMIYNHGSEPNPNGVPALAKLYVDQGYAFFAPDRHGQGLSKDAGPYIVNLEQSSGGGQASVALHELYNRDVIAAIDWLKEQPWANTRRLLMTGISYGGIQTLLTAEKDPGIRAYLPFAPAAESWGNSFLQQRLIKAVKNEKAPMFLIQAEGDYNLGPSMTLGPLLEAKGDHEKWRHKIFGKFGCTNQDAHARFASRCDGIAIWSPEALKFIDRNSK